MAQNKIPKSVSHLPSTRKRPRQAIGVSEASGPIVPEKKSADVKQIRTTGQRKVSLAIRKKIAEAARARWAARKNSVNPQLSTKDPVAKQTAPKPAQKGITAAGRKRLSELAKARWAEKRTTEGNGE